MEHTFTLDDGTMYKPDIVTKVNENRAQIIDVIVRFERGNNLKEACHEKVSKYSHIVPNVRRQLGVGRVDIIPLVIGSRGGLPGWSADNCRKVGLKKNDLLTVVMIAMRSSIEMVSAFLDYG
ncbi:hypothetical protein QAD02_011687 [Eretmocerus hayati]|uniref:Uncharacterized protein n=1 Tax=Eretmocerus hayati TaxID=131215 RepID=A0ACC2NYM4_9HYME|nr:hypothetical protein QAD02_011687 [Eretmocerus hayati]